MTILTNTGVNAHVTVPPFAHANILPPPDARGKTLRGFSITTALAPTFVFCSDGDQ